MRARAEIVQRAFLFYLSCNFRYGYSYPTDVEDRLGQSLIHDGKKVFSPIDKEISSGRCTGPNEEQGRCDYLSKCFSQEYDSNFELSTRHACVIDRAYVGVCCRNRSNRTREHSGLGENLADVLPVIAASAGASRIVWQEKESMPANESPERQRGCGISPKQKNRLVSSQPADPSEWPWMAALIRKGGDQFCGGVLITDRHVLTAAHCVYRLKPRDIEIRLGEYDLTAAEETRSLDFAVTEIRVHEDFQYTTYENDIAIAKTHRPTVFNSYVWPICLPPIDEAFENRSAIVIGWGTRYYGGPASTVLMQVQVPIWSQKKCVDSFSQRIPKTAMCAGAYDGGRDACQGDSGGPLLHRLDNGRWVNVGIVSWGIRCGDPGHPGVYTRVNAYLDWIFANSLF